MSEDLLAAFCDVPGDETSAQRVGPQNPSFSFFGDLSASASASLPAKGPLSNLQQTFDYQEHTVSRQYLGPAESVESEEDDFGDFEDAPKRTDFTKGAVVDAHHSSNPDVNSSPHSGQATKASVFIDSNLSTTIESSRNSADHLRKKSSPEKKVISRDPNVLFDAEDEELEDDFGDFEDADEKPHLTNEAPHLLRLDKHTISDTFRPKASSSLLDLESLDLTGRAITELSEHESSNFPSPYVSKTTSLNVLKSPEIRTKPSKSKSRERLAWQSEPTSSATASAKEEAGVAREIVTTPRQQEEEQWDEFNTWEDSFLPSRAPPSTRTGEPSSEIPKPEEPWDDFNAWEQPTSDTVTKIVPALAQVVARDFLPDELPPTNIPPPAIILSLFPEIFTTAECTLFKPALSQNQVIRTQVFSDRLTITLLKSFIAIATVCGRVVAGRKHRWKRDVLLSQSMRIGQATGSKSGMKLASVDKAETAKEDGAVADVIRAWQVQVGRLKSAVGEVKKAGSADVGIVPELKEVMSVRTVKEVEGGIVGFKPCALCGLKREERIVKVDFDVQDSFGEWWIDGLSMHRACRNFWSEHKDSLRQR